MKVIDIKLNGKKTKIGGPTAAALKLADIIKKLGNKEFLDADGLAKLAGLSANGIKGHMVRNSELFEGLFTVIPGDNGHRKVWGNKRSITALNVALEVANNA